MRDTQKTLRWITDILKKHDIPFAVCGGLAAKSYGSPRPLNDIDIDIPVYGFAKILPDIASYIVFGPAHFVDERWNMHLATLNHYGQEIDIGGGDEVKICDNRDQQWKNIPTDFADIEMRDIFGVLLPVLSRRQLAAYKCMLAGEHQLIDLAAIANTSS